MDIKELQKEIKDVEDRIERKGGKVENPELMRVLKINEEFGEVCDVILRLLVKTRKGDKSDLEEVKEHLAEELVDTITPLIGIANVFEIDLEAAFMKKFNINRDRYNN